MRPVAELVQHTWTYDPKRDTDHFAALMASGSPRQIGGGQFNPNGGQTPQNSYRIMSVSNDISRDMEVWVPYDTELFQANTKLVIGMTYQSTLTIGRMDPPLMQQFGNFVLVDVHDQWGQIYLIFARNTLPTATLLAQPSVQWDDRKTWRWPTVMRGMPNVQFTVGSGANLLNVTVTPNLCPGKDYPTIIVNKQWWTVQPWPDSLMMAAGSGLNTSLVYWDYHGLARGSYDCLHPTIQMPPLTGVAAVRNQAGTFPNIQGIEFPATDPVTWLPDPVSDTQEQIRGRWLRTLRVALPPFDPMIYPPNPRVYSS